MAYSYSADLTLGAGNTGLTLTPTLRNSDGTTAAGMVVVQNFEVAVGSGSYYFEATIPDGHRGYVEYATGATFKAKSVVSPQEVENTDTKTSTRSSHTAADVWASGTRTLTSFGTLVADTVTAVWASGTRTLTSFGTLVADVATAVWAAGTRTLTTFGTLVADVATAVWAALSRTLTSGAAPSAAAVADAVWDEVRSDHLQLGSFGIANQVVRDGQAQGGSATTLTLDAGASAVDDFYANDVIFLKVGTGAGQVNIISDYVGATKVATVLAPWVVTPDATSCFIIIPLALIPGASNLSAADIWAYAPRTLTQSAAQVAAAVQGSDLVCKRGDTFTASLTGIGALTGRTKLWFTVKGNKAQADTAALLQIVEGTGLTVLNGAAATASQGSLTVTDASLGNVTIVLDEEATALLRPSAHYYYDIQMLSAGGVVTRTEGDFEVHEDVTRAIS